MIPTVDHCKSEYERVGRQRQVREPIQFSHTRWEAFDRFLALGFPPAADDEWNCPEVPPIAQHFFTMAAESPDPRCHTRRELLHLPGPFAAELVFVNGYFLPQAAQVGVLPSRVRVDRLASVLHEHADEILPHLARVVPHDRLPLAALNTALFIDGACIRIPANTVVELPIHVRFISTGEADCSPAMSHTRLLVLLGAASAATVIESWAGLNRIQYFTNAVTEIVIGEGARLDRYMLQRESANSYHVSTTGVIGGRDARCSTRGVSLGGGFVRSDVAAVLDGECGAFAETRLYLAGGRRLVEDHASIDHAMPFCRSTRTVAAVLANQARIVHDSTVAVRSGARAAHARQSNRTLLLSDDARSNSTSHLQTLADATKYGQRTVVRRVEDAAASYSGADGMSDEAARRAGALAFAGKALNGIRRESLGNTIRDLVRQETEYLLESAIGER